MARLVAACALGVVIGTAVGAALGARAQELDDGALQCRRESPDQTPVCGDPQTLFEAEALHEQVPELGFADLVGASNSTGLGPVAYSISVGELIPTSPPTPMRSQPPPASAPAAGGGASTPSGSGMWGAIKNCETPGLGWNANTGNGFSGGLQFTPQTWRAYGGRGQAWQASPAEQIAVAERVLHGQGWRAWPTCSRRLGLR